MMSLSSVLWFAPRSASGWAAVVVAAAVLTIGFGPGRVAAADPTPPTRAEQLRTGVFVGAPSERARARRQETIARLRAQRALSATQQRARALSESRAALTAQERALIESLSTLDAPGARAARPAVRGARARVDADRRRLNRARLAQQEATRARIARRTGAFRRLDPQRRIDRTVRFARPKRR